MELRLQRHPSSPKSTLGQLFVNDVWQAWTLEDVERPEKIQNETAIPAGRYKVELTMSARFKRIMPLLLDVPNYTGVRIHFGNSSKDTEGCILVGTTHEGEDWIGNSVVAFDHLFPVLQAAFDAGEEIWIDVCSA